MVKEMVLSQKRQDLQEALIAAARVIVAQHGYQALRARDLAAEVSCAVGAIYNVFPDLDALILTVKSRTLDELQSEVLERLGPDQTQAGDDGRKRLLDLSRIYLGFAQRNQLLWKSAFEHSSPETPALQTYMKRLDAIFGNVEQPLVAMLPDIPARQRQLLARALFSAVHGVVSLGLDQKLGEISITELQWQVETILDAALAGLRTPPNA